MVISRQADLCRARASTGSARRPITIIICPKPRGFTTLFGFYSAKLEVPATFGDLTAQLASVKEYIKLKMFVINHSSASLSQACAQMDVPFHELHPPSSPVSTSAPKPPKRLAKSNSIGQPLCKTKLKLSSMTSWRTKQSVHCCRDLIIFRFRRPSCTLSADHFPGPAVARASR